MIIVLSGMSGVGKTTIAEMLCLNGFVRSISYTTRQPRMNENHRKDYFFIQHSEFQEKLKSNFFLEHTVQFDNFYGTSNENIENLLKQQNKIVLCLDDQGYLNAKKRWGEIVLGFYLLPPSFDELQKRLLNRNSSDYEIRLASLHAEWSKYMTKTVVYDYEIKADSIDQVVSNLLKLIKINAQTLF